MLKKGACTQWPVWNFGIPKHVPLGTNPVRISTVTTIAAAHAPAGIVFVFALYDSEDKWVGAGVGSGVCGSRRDGKCEAQCDDGEDDFGDLHCGRYFDDL